VRIINDSLEIALHKTMYDIWSMSWVVRCLLLWVYVCMRFAC